MDPLALGYTCFFKNYKSNFPESLQKTTFVKRFEDLYEATIAELLFRMRRECNQVVKTSENNYCFSLFRLMNSLVVKANPDDYGEVKKEFIEL